MRSYAATSNNAPFIAAAVTIVPAGCYRKVTTTGGEMDRHWQSAIKGWSITEESLADTQQTVARQRRR